MTLGWVFSQTEASSARWEDDRGRGWKCVAEDGKLKEFLDGLEAWFEAGEEGETE